MQRNTTAIIQDDKKVKFNTQKQFDQFNFPFTFNPVIGCALACKYCYSPIFVSKVPTDKGKKFFEESIVQLNAAERAATELNRLRNLPQHLKRVQINETSEYYQPRVLHEIEAQGRDVMLEILEEFQEASFGGNSWMIHLLTKSNGIEQHIPKLMEMKDMVQVEISFATPHENIRKNLEFFTLPTDERLKVVEKLAKAGIFVRIMAMPFYGDENDLALLKKMTFDAGAKAFKNKELNYWDWDTVTSATYDDMIHDRIPRVNGRPDTKNLNYMIKSGEDVVVNGEVVIANVLMPGPKVNRKYPNWGVEDTELISERLVMQPVSRINCGYADISKIDWGYII